MSQEPSWHVWWQSGAIDTDRQQQLAAHIARRRADRRARRRAVTFIIALTLAALIVEALAITGWSPR